MERETLQRYLNAGLSLERIGELVGKHPSTVGYWVKKHGLVNPRTRQHSGKGGLERRELERMVDAGLTLRQIVPASTTARWHSRRTAGVITGVRRAKSPGSRSGGGA